MMQQKASNRNCNYRSKRSVTFLLRPWQFSVMYSDMKSILVHGDDDLVEPRSVDRLMSTPATALVHGCAMCSNRGRKGVLNNAVAQPLEYVLTFKQRFTIKSPRKAPLQQSRCYHGSTMSLPPAACTPLASPALMNAITTVGMPKVSPVRSSAVAA